MIDIEVDPPRSRLADAWNELRMPGFYQDPEYGDLYASTTRHGPLRVVGRRDGHVAGYAQAIEFREGRKLVGSLGAHATIRHGPILEPADDASLAQSILQACAKALRSRVAYLRVYPGRTELPMQAVLSAGFKRASWLNYYVYLKASESDILARVSKKRRYGIRKATERGVTVRLAESRDDIRQAYRLLAATHRRVKFPLEPETFFEQAFRRFHPTRLRAFLAEWQGRPLATTVVAIDGSSAVNWFAGSSIAADTNRFYPNDIAIWEAIRWARSSGFDWFDMGGGGPPENLAGFVEFKKQFGGQGIDVGHYTFVPSKWKLAVAGKGFDLLRKIRGMRR